MNGVTTSMAEGRRGLGRGLSALLGESEAENAAAPAGEPAGVREIPIELIHRNPDQPRRRFGETEIGELADSIREKGVLQPVLLRPAPGNSTTVRCSRSPLSRTSSAPTWGSSRRR
jgi:ParB family chromosome partitioning protein